MAKELSFSLAGAEYATAPVKLERKKIYGWSDLVATDKAGEVCGTAYLSPDDALLIPSGGYKQGTVDDIGRWVDKSELTACDTEGNELKQYASSFDAVISLDKTVSEEEFLDNDWEAVYQLVNAELAAAVGDNIYKFEFSYRGGANHNDGYLINTPGACSCLPATSRIFHSCRLSTRPSSTRWKRRWRKRLTTLISVCSKM